jgi:hypothetical protein
MVRFGSPPLPVNRLIMRAPFPPSFFKRGHFVSRWPGMAFGLMGSLWLGTLGADEDQDKKFARLGFAFDQHAHDEAVAAASADPPAGENGNAGTSSDDVLQLPKYTVTGKRVPFKEREVLSPKGRLDLAKKTYLTPAYQKTFGLVEAVASLFMNPMGGWQPNNPEAMALYEDTEQMRRNTEMKELLNAAAPDDHNK